MDKPKLADITSDSALAQRLEFLVEIDKLKSVFRQTLLIDGKRNENDAEHSWHLVLYAMLLCGYAAEPIDVAKVIRMVAVHDLVEIDAGDTLVYDVRGNATKEAREKKAADRLFSLLPEEQASLFFALWREFEGRETPEARFAAAIDRLQPLLHNYHTEGHAWKTHRVTFDRVIERNKHIEAGAPALWEFAKNMISDAVHKGYLNQKEQA